MAEERSGLAYVAFGDELRGPGWRRWAGCEWRGGIDLAGEAEFAAKGFQIVDVALGVVAEAEVFSFVEFDDVEGVVEDFGGEAPGRTSARILW